MAAGRGSSSSSDTDFPMPRIPALLFPTPPPPPPATALPSNSLYLSSYSSSSLRHAPSITSFPILVLTVLGILAASFLLLAYYVFVIRCCLTWHRASSTPDDVAGLDLIVSRRGRRRPQRATTTSSSSAAPAADAAEPQGLDDAAIRALPAFSYRKKKLAAAAESSAPATECAVCLGEFDEGDRVRMLPACLHVFHLACVDAWLQGNATCPLCRADVAATLCRLLPPPPEEEVVPIQVVVVPGGAEEDGQDTLTMARQRQAIVVAPVQFAEEDACTEHQVGAEKTKSTVDDACHGMTERRTDGEVVPQRTRTRRSLSMDGDAMAAGGELRLQIQSILQRDSHSHTPRDDHDSDNSSSARV